MIPNDVIDTFYANRDYLALPKLLRDMYVQDHTNVFFSEQDLAANVKNIEKTLKDHYDI